MLKIWFNILKLVYKENLFISMIKIARVEVTCLDDGGEKKWKSALLVKREKSDKKALTEKRFYENM